MDPLEKIPSVGNAALSTLKKLGISTTEELLSFYPFRYDIIKRSDLLQIGMEDRAIIDGVVESIPSTFFINKKLNKMTFKIQTGTMLIGVVIFNRAYLKAKITPGAKVIVMGKYNKKNGLLTASDIRFGNLPSIPTIEPVYHTVYGISSKKVEAIAAKCLDKSFEVEDYIPSEYQEKYHFLDKKASVICLHKPDTLENLKKARLRTKYEELFVFMIKMQYLKNNKQNKIGLERKIDFGKVKQMIETLPFMLTEDQLVSIQQIHQDLESNNRMNRLLQGDVGSGKTIVSIIAMYMNYLGGYQSALMAPTEILAQQHYQSIKSLCRDLPVRVALLTGRCKAKEKKEIGKALEDGSIDIIVGTHALISTGVNYKNLGLVITDEQHRFGVGQRGNLKNKGITPDILYMSATPIPRTYALTLYGDMEVSNIKTRPLGRKKILTKVRKESEMKKVLEDMYQELQSGHQIYVIAPLIEESDKIDLKNVDELYEKMNLAFGKKYKIGILHGKCTPEEKEQTMESFETNQVQILISTTVIEVGIDVKNATMIIIFDAYRFGLSTLHQLRGRVGRNKLQSYCVLISNYEKERLRIMEETDDGFKISEEDFRLRGSGDLFGMKQSGDMNFGIADIKKDFSILMKAKEDSAEYLLNNNDNEYLQRVLDKVDELS